MSNELIADRYEVLDKLGSGGTAIVYKVLDKTLKKTCALKTIKNKQADSNLLVRFQREAKAASSLRHKNIVSILDFGLDERNNPYIVMDYVEGESLDNYIKSHGPLTIEQTVSAFIQICDAMAYTHAHHVLHRDLKSANIIVLKTNKAKSNQIELNVQILDFGLAKVLVDSVDDNLTKTGVSIGTPTFMSPEQASGKSLDERSEVYSLGCVLFHSLTGLLPLKADTIFETINKQINEVAPTLKAASGKEFPPIIESIVAKSLKKEPEKRFQNMNEMKASFQNVLELLKPKVEEEDYSKDNDYSKLVFKIVELGPKLLIPITIVLSIGAYFIVDKINKSKNIEQKNEEIAKLSYLGTFDKATWELGIEWYKKYGTTDKNLYALTKESGIKNLALYDERDFSDKALAHALKIPLDGLGYGDSRIGRAQLMMTVNAQPHLKHLYIGGLPTLKDEDLKLLTPLKELRFLGISRSEFTDNCFQYLTALDNLDTLKCSKNKKITGSGLTELYKLPKLKRLTLSYNQLSHRGWKNLPGLKTLKTLSVRKSNIEDQDLTYLSQMPSLKKLDISFCENLTDRGLKKLTNLKKLELLYIFNCPRISTEAKSSLAKALPNCLIDERQMVVFEDLEPILMTEKFD